MKILSIGNIFESYSLIVDHFCPVDGEIVAKNLNHRISGAAIAVTAMAAFLEESAYIISKGLMTATLEKYVGLMEKRGISITVLNASANNTLITVYDQVLSRKCYSFTPNSINGSDLEHINFGEYDLVFFCCLPYLTIKDIFNSNKSLQSTCSVVLPSGLTASYFSEHCYNLNSNYLFINRGELGNLFNYKNGIGFSTGELIKRLNMPDTNIIVTQGREGIVGIVDNEYFEQTVDDITNIVHPGGAGDSFATGFMISLKKGCSMSECCSIGHQCASKMLSVYNVEEFLRGSNEIIWKQPNK